MITELLNINLVEEMELDKLPSEKKEELVKQMLETIESRINLEVLSVLEEDDKKELEQILDSDSDLVEFLRKKIPDFDNLVKEIVVNYKKEVLELQGLATNKS